MSARAGELASPPLGEDALVTDLQRARSGARSGGWQAALLLTLLSVVMFVPIRRYALPTGLPFALEPYRAVLAISFAVVILALLVDPTFRWKPVRFGWGVGLFLGTTALSIVVNAVQLQERALLSVSLMSLANITILMSAFFLVRQLLTTAADVRRMLVFLVWAGAIVAAFAVIERVTHFNVFHHLGEVLPLNVLRDEDGTLRAGGARAIGSSQHPIALSVMLATLIPVGLHLGEYGRTPRNPVNRRIVYGLLAAIMLLGVVTAVSRTAMVALAVMFLVVLVLRPTLAALILVFAVPALLVAAVILPRLVDELLLSFLNVDELIASQYTSPGWTGQGRLADLGPAMAQVAQQPIFGGGFGARIVVGPDANGFILDNQPLGTLMDAGIVGVVGLAALVLMPIVLLMMRAFAKHETPERAKLAFTLAIAGVGYAVSMFFYDAFGFIQSLMVWLALLAAGAWLLTTRAETS
jgi:hypothetical protein